MPNLPSGTVTFVFSDIEGSTALLKRLGDDGYAELLKTHRRLVRETFADYHGQEIDTQGDAFFYSFTRAREAVAAAVAVQRAHHEQAWPEGVSVRVRLGLHTGEPAVGEDGYTGLDVVRASRIAAVGRGGQILLSDTTRAIVATDLPPGVALRSLGEQRLRDIDQPEPLHEVRIADIPTTELAPPVSPSAPEGFGGDVMNALPDWIRAASSRGRPFLDRTSQLIEERVLDEIDRSLRARAEDEAGGDKPDQPGSERGESASVADEIGKLQALREAGALTDEQYAKAVDRALSERD
jgi:class 3 adenylate cyclase